MGLTLVYVLMLLPTADFTVGFNPDMYQFPGGAGDENLTLQITQLAGILECDFEVTVIFTDGPKASEFLFSTKKYILQNWYGTLLLYSYGHVVLEIPNTLHNFF